MRSGSVVGADDFIRDLQKLGADMEKVKREMLKAGGQEMADAWKREITSRGFEDSGAMLKGVRYQVKAKKGGGMRAEITSRGEVVRPSKKGKGSTVTNAAKAFYIKRFSFVESNNTPVSFISEAKGSKLVDLSDDLHPQVKLTFGGRQEGREPEILDAEEFIAKKGLAAKGKKCSGMDLKAVEFIEPLHKPEDDIVPEEEEPIEIELDDEIPEIPETPAAAPEGGEAAGILQKEKEKEQPDEPASDFTDWTLF